MVLWPMKKLKGGKCVIATTAALFHDCSDLCHRPLIPWGAAAACVISLTDNEYGCCRQYSNFGQYAMAAKQTLTAHNSGSINSGLVHQLTDAMRDHPRTLPLWTSYPHNGAGWRPAGSVHIAWYTVGRGPLGLQCGLCHEPKAWNAHSM